MKPKPNRTEPKMRDTDSFNLNQTEVKSKLGRIKPQNGVDLHETGFKPIRNRDFIFEKKR